MPLLSLPVDAEIFGFRPKSIGEDAEINFYVAVKVEPDWHRDFIVLIITRALYVRNLPFKITAEEMYDIFRKYGPIRQIRIGEIFFLFSTVCYLFIRHFSARFCLCS
jgi:RNA recognition motif-containing protein